MSEHEFERFDRIQIRHLSGNPTINLYGVLQELDAIGSKGVKYTTDTDQANTVVGEVVAHSIDGRSTPMGRSLQNAVDNVPSRSSLPSEVLEALGYTSEEIESDDVPTEVDVWVSTGSQPAFALTPPVRETIGIDYELES